MKSVRIRLLRRMCTGLAFGLCLVATVPAQGAETITSAEEPRHRLVFESESYRIYHVLLDASAPMEFHEHRHDNVAVLLSNSEISNERRGGDTKKFAIEPGMIAYGSASPESPFTHRINLLSGEPFRNITLEFLKPRPEAETDDANVDAALEQRAKSIRGRAYEAKLEPGQVVMSPGPGHDVLVTCLGTNSLQLFQDNAPSGEWKCEMGDFRVLASGPVTSFKNSGTEAARLSLVSLR